MPFDLASLPISAIGWIVPISLLANMTERRMVFGVSAFSSSATSTRPSRPTGTYVTSKPCRSSRLPTSMLARCSMVVVTTWFPFSRYISATPLRARLMDSVPPEVKTISLGSRAPISAATSARALSTALSASQPNGWLRLAGWPNFSVKYGSIASSTRGSTGVVDWLSMKIGSFNVMRALSWRGRCRRPWPPSRRDQLDSRGRVAGQLRERHRVQHRADAGLDLLDGTAEVAAGVLGTSVVFDHAADDPERPLQRADHLPDRDLGGRTGQDVSPFGPVVARDELLFRQPLENLGQALLRNVELVRDALGAHRASLAVGGDEVDGHQPIVSALGEPEHPSSSRYPTGWIADLSGRILALLGGIVKASGPILARNRRVPTGRTRRWVRIRTPLWRRTL